MKNKISVIGLGVFFLMLVMIFSPARNIQATGGWDITSIYFYNLPDASIYNIVENIMDWFLGLIGAFGIIGFAIAGFLYLTASGNETQMEKAKKAMMYSIIGVIVALAGIVALQFAGNLLDASLAF